MELLIIIYNLLSNEKITAGHEITSVFFRLVSVVRRYKLNFGEI